jgi:hypothetical protein
MSAGICTVRQTDSVDDILTRADAALYRAKDAGRNPSLLRSPVCAVIVTNIVLTSKMGTSRSGPVQDTCQVAAEALSHIGDKWTSRMIGVLSDGPTRSQTRIRATDIGALANGRFAPKAAAWRGFALTPRKARRITPDPKVRSLGSLKSLKSPTRRWISYENRAPNTRHEHGVGAGSRVMPTNHRLLLGVFQSSNNVRALLGVGNADEGL